MTVVIATSQEGLFALGIPSGILDLESARRGWDEIEPGMLGTPAGSDGFEVAAVILLENQVHRAATILRHIFVPDDPVLIVIVPEKLPSSLVISGISIAEFHIPFDIVIVPLSIIAASIILDAQELRLVISLGFGDDDCGHEIGFVPINIQGGVGVGFRLGAEAESLGGSYEKRTACDFAQHKVDQKYERTTANH